MLKVEAPEKPFSAFRVMVISFETPTATFLPFLSLTEKTVPHL